jgi:site-specific DNA-methyltransferase (adenine-specific)
VANDGDLAWLPTAFREAARVLKDDRFLVSFYGWHRAAAFLAAWKQAGLYPVGHLVWTKGYASNARGGAGYLEYRHECAYLVAKRRPVLTGDPIFWIASLRFQKNASARTIR